MAPVESSLFSTLTNLIRRTPSPSPSSAILTIRNLSPKAAALAAGAQNLVRRGEFKDPGAGVLPPTRINNKAFFALFALIGVAFVITGIWFFFWAKNGGFYFKENDWDDYKSTVLRRKGPNGTTLSGATASTDLGGGSVVHGEDKRSRWGRKRGKGAKSVADSRYKDFDEGESIVGTELSSEMSEVKWKAQHSEPIKDKKKKKSRFGRGERVPDEEMDVGVPEEVRETVRAYRHEKPARVGGINKAPDSSAFDGSTQDGSSAASDLLSHREKTPTNTPTKVKKERKDNYTGGTGGIRKVVSTSTPASSSSFWTRATGSGSKKNEEDERIKSEARKLQEKGRAAQRRDFSFQAGDDATTSSSSVVGGDEERRARREERRARREAERAQIPGSYYEESVVGSDLSGDIGTKSYHHPIPGLSSQGSDYVEERRKKRNAGYRRDAH